MRGLAGIVICVAAIVVPLPSGSVFGTEVSAEASALRTFYSANGFLNRGLFDLAVAEYEAFLEAYPEHERAAVARYGLGVSLYRLARYDEAVDALRPVGGEPDWEYAAEAATILGQCRLAVGAYEEACTPLEFVIAQHCEHDLADEAATLLAEASYRAGEYPDAVRICEWLAANRPDSPLRERAELFGSLAEIARGDHGAAVKRLTRMSERFPDGQYKDQTALLLARSLHRTNAIGQALEKYRAVIRAATDEFVPDAMFGLATLLREQQQLSAAGEMLDGLLERFPDDEVGAGARLLRGRVWFDLGDWDRAEPCFARVAAAEGELGPEAEYWWAKCELRRGDCEAAARRLGTTVKGAPDHRLAPEMRYDRAVALLRSGRPAASLEELAAFRSEFPDHPLAPDALQLAAVASHEREDYERSAEFCREFRRAYPDHALGASVAFLVGENAFLAEDYELAVDAFTRYLDAYPNDAQRRLALFREGMARYHLGRYNEAADVLMSVVHGRETEPRFRTALLAVGDVEFRRGAWSLAESLLTDYVAFGLGQPGADDALLKLGLARHRQEKYEKAIEAYDRLIAEFEESGHHLQAVFERGQALMAIGRVDDATAVFGEVLDADSDSRFALHALRHLGAMAADRQEHEEAAEYFGRAAAAADDDALRAETRLRQGQALMDAGAFGGAVDVLSALVDDHPESAAIGDARARLAVALARLDRPREALDAMEAVGRSETAVLDAALNAVLIYERAWCLRALERPEEAAGAYRELIERHRDHPLCDRALLELAELEAAGEDYETASELLSTLLDRAEARGDAPSPLREQALYRLGIAEFRRGNHREAARALEELVESFPDSEWVGPASLLCGESLAKDGAHQRAVTHLRRVVERHRESDEFGPALLRLGECLATLQHWARSEEAFAEYLRRFADSDLWYQARFGMAWARENQQRYDEAIDGYREVVGRHEGPTAARAQFQIGECLFARNELAQAVREFLKVDILYAYPQWSAAALYEAGRCFEQLGDLTEARARFEEVRATHGETRWGDLAAARIAQLAPPSLPGHE